jgi:hypothetical protein
MHILHYLIAINTLLFGTPYRVSPYDSAIGRWKLLYSDNFKVNSKHIDLCIEPCNEQLKIKIKRYENDNLITIKKIILCTVDQEYSYMIPETKQINNSETCTLILLKSQKFIKSIVLQSSDLLDIGNLGYVEGISKIILKEMNNIEQNKRPMHCTDAKRDVLYIKDENKWEKEGPENPRLINAIREIEQKNIGVFLNEWMPSHPNHRNSESSENNEYMKLMKETMNGSEENITRVIKRIAKEVLIDKY